MKSPCEAGETGGGRAGTVVSSGRRRVTLLFSKLFDVNALCISWPEANPEGRAGAEPALACEILPGKKRPFALDR
jgi:hypothetical protein